MYVVLDKKNRPVAFHDDYDVVKKYVISMTKDDLEIAHVGKKKAKAFRDYNELYLVRYGDSYLTREMYDVMKQRNAPDAYNYQVAIDVLYRLVEEGYVDRKDEKHIQKSIEILERALEDLDNQPVDSDLVESLESSKELDDMYKSIIGR